MTSSNLNDFTLPTYYVRQAAEQLAEMGVDTDHWLSHVGMCMAQLSDGEMVLNFEQIRTLSLKALSLTGEPALGLLIGERLLVNSHGILGYAAMSSSSLRQAMDLVQRFIGVRISLISYHYEIQGQEVRQILTENRPLGDVQRLFHEGVSLTIKNALDYVTMKACPVGYVAFTFPDPGYGALVQDMFNCEVRYNQGWTGCTTPLEVLDLPLRQADPAMFHAAEAICQQELQKLNQQHTLSARIRRLMLEKQNGFPSLQVTARMLNMTPRTMHRRLQEEGTSFIDLLEDVRQGLAVEHLKSGQMSIQEVAYTLGYNDVSNFRRAFKRWTNMTPSDFVAQM